MLKLITSAYNWLLDPTDDAPLLVQATAALGLLFLVWLAFKVPQTIFGLDGLTD